MKKRLKKIADDNSGLSFCIVLLIVAVFSVFIVGTYQILDRHVIENETDSEMHNAYYQAEGAVRLTSTYIDKIAAELAEKMQEEAADNSKEIEDTEFIERLNQKIDAMDFKTKVSDSFDYDIQSVMVNEIANPSPDKFTCAYTITAVVNYEDGMQKKVRGTYGIIFNTTTYESEEITTLTIDESSPMLVALEDVKAESMSVLSGKIELIGDFTYPTYYPIETIEGINYENYTNQYDGFYSVDQKSLNRGKVKIPTIPNAPTIESFDLPEFSGKNLSDDNSVGIFEINSTIEFNKNNKYKEYNKYTILNRISSLNYGKLTLDVKADDCYFLCKILKFDNLLTINANADNFKLYISEELILQNGGKLKVNTNGHDVYIAANKISSDTSGVIGSYLPTGINITTTGSGTVYIYINDYEQYKDITFTTNITNESDVIIIFNCDFYVDAEGVSGDTSYDSMVFNVNKPSSADAGDLKVFIIDDPDTATEHYFRLYKNSPVTFNAEDGTNLKLIADHVYMQGKMIIEGDATLDMYARETCFLDGIADNDNCLSNFTDSDKTIDDDQKAEKIVNTKLNLYYYGTDDFIINNYKACSNFYISSDANIEINNSYFYGNIYSAAAEPGASESRTELWFKNSYLSCGAIYAPNVNVIVDGDINSANKYQTTSTGNHATCVFASITGTNIFIYGDSLLMSSCVKKSIGVVSIKLDFETLVAATGDTYVADHFIKGIKEIK